MLLAITTSLGLDWIKIENWGVWIEILKNRSICEKVKNRGGYFEIYTYLFEVIACCFLFIMVYIDFLRISTNFLVY